MVRCAALHCHSSFSFHAGVASIEELVARAAALGYEACALTDTDRMSGLIRFYTCCQRYGIRPVLGAEITQPGRPRTRMVVLAKNRRGYTDICDMLTSRHLDRDTFSLEAVCAASHPDCVFMSDSPALVRCLAQGPNRDDAFGELINNDARSRRRSRAVEQAAQAYGLPVALGADAFFLHPHDHLIHMVLRAIGLVSTLSRLRPDEYAPRGAYLRSPQRMQELFPRHQEARANTVRIAQRCNVTFRFGKWIMPRIAVPRGYTPDSYLERLAMQGLQRRYGHTPHIERARRIQRMELDTIAALGYSSYFLMVKKIRDWANHELKGGYRKATDCSILRGSAANSITFYNIGVSDLDPIRYDLYFQRFLNEDRASPPDADLDFAWDEREKVLDYMVRTWGRDRVAITCTTNHFRRRSAFRETAKVLGYSEQQVSDIMDSDAIPRRRMDDACLRHIRTIAARIQGKPRFLGQHPGGVIVTNEPLRHHVACEYADAARTRIVTQIDMHNGIDELGLIKFDILGNGSLAVLRDTLAQLQGQDIEDPHVEEYDKCFADPHVRRAIRQGETRGIFYIESPAQTRLNRKAQAETFEEVTITSSLVRPAGTAYTARFVQRHREAKQGIRTWRFLHPSLEPILADTHDVCAFQEHVTKICCLIAGMSYAQADKVRKMMNSLHEGVLHSDEYHQTAETFISGCMQTKGLGREQAMALWERVSSFTGFSFCKSHSASYAQLSFQCTYLKVHYPAQFLAAVIGNQHGFYTPEVYFDEARRRGITILPMDINASRVRPWGAHTWLRPGFMHIRDLRRSIMEAIVAERAARGRFANLADFCARVPVRRKEAQLLVLAGAFDGFGATRPQLLWELDGMQLSPQSRQPSLFARAVGRDVARARAIGLSDYSFATKCLSEMEVMGFMLSGDLLSILDLHPAAQDAVAACRLQACTGQRVKVFGRCITQRGHRVQGSGAHMLFLTIEDKSGYVDIVFWPAVYARFYTTIAQGGPFAVWGKVSREWDTYTIEADRVASVSWSPAQIDFTTASKRLARGGAQRSGVYPAGASAQRGRIARCA